MERGAVDPMEATEFLSLLVILNSFIIVFQWRHTRQVEFCTFSILYVTQYCVKNSPAAVQSRDRLPPAAVAQWKTFSLAEFERTGVHNTQVQLLLASGSQWLLEIYS